MIEEKFDFENLKIYQKALDYAAFVYKLVSLFPKSEVFTLVDQFKRASVSICLNIAEGSGGSNAEFRRFLKITRRSIRECVALTEVSHRQGFISVDQKKRSRDFCTELSKMCSGLMKSLNYYSELLTPNS